MSRQELAPVIDAEVAPSPAVQYIAGSLATRRTVFENYATASSPITDPVFGPTVQQTSFDTKGDWGTIIDGDTKGD